MPRRRILDMVLPAKESEAPEQAQGSDPFAILNAFTSEYRDYVNRVLSPLKSQLSAIFDDWQTGEYWQTRRGHNRRAVPSPVKRASIRLKQPRSVVRKILAKPDQYPTGLPYFQLHKMTDILGARIVVSFLSDLPVIDREIRESGYFEISRERTPHAYLEPSVFDKLGLDMEQRTKASGYESIHYVLRLKKRMADGSPFPWFELQLRTLTQDVWAEVEHLLGYKHETSSGQVRGQFQLIGHLLNTIDEGFDMLRADLMERQERGLLEGKEPLTADNLPGVLSERGLSCSQYDIQALLEMAASCGVTTVDDLRNVITPEKIKSVHAVGNAALGESLVGSELILALMLMSVQGKGGDPVEMLTRWGEFNRMLQDL